AEGSTAGAGVEPDRAWTRPHHSKHGIGCQRLLRTHVCCTMALVVNTRTDAVEGCGFAARASAFFIDLIYLALLSLVVGAVVGVMLGVVVVIRGGAYTFDQELLPWLNLVN